jgi:hypothetical protein
MSIERETIEMIERSVRSALANMNDPRLNALPVDLLVVFVSHACTAQIVQSHTHLIEQMLQADKQGKQ